jgi:hypothetical protein
MYLPFTSMLFRIHVMEYTQGNTIWCVYSLNIPNFMVFLNTCISYGSSSLTEKLYFLDISYTSPHFNVSLSFSGCLDVSSYVDLIIFVSPSIFWPL